MLVHGLRMQDDYKLAQGRLEKVWKKLELPRHLQMDMAIRYSNPYFSVHLNKVGGYSGEQAGGTNMFVVHHLGVLAIIVLCFSWRSCFPLVR